MSTEVPSREQLLFSLYEAAELEHNLMCTYLYAAFSLKSSDAPELLPREAEAIARWRTVVMQVALEEWLISSGKLVTATDVAKCVKDRISPEMRARNDALLSQNRVAPELLASQLMKDVDSETPTAGSGLVTAPPGLWVGRPVAKPAAGELSVTEPGQPPSVTLPIAQPATPAIKPRASDATELVDFVPVKADGTSAAPAAGPKATPAALEAAPPAPRSARSALLVLLLVAALAVVLWRLLVH